MNKRIEALRILLQHMSEEKAHADRIRGFHMALVDGEWPITPTDFALMRDERERVVLSLYEAATR